MSTCQISATNNFQMILTQDCGFDESKTKNQILKKANFNIQMHQILNFFMQLKK